VLLLEQGIITLDLAQTLEFRGRFRIEDHIVIGHEPPLPHQFSPSGQHERVDIQGVRHVLHLHARQSTHPHRPHLELVRVAVYFPRPFDSWHHTPPPLG